MTHRILFVAALLHPEQFQRDLAAMPDNPPLFPTSYGYHYWERAMKKRGYTLDVFWRNLAGYGARDVADLQMARFSNRITPGKVMQALLRRLPPTLNPGYRKRNALLLQQALDFQPDILWVVGDNTVIFPQTLEAIKAQTGAKIVFASGTSPIVFSKPIERDAARLYDLVLVNDYYHGIQWLELGAQRMRCLPIAAIDPDFHTPPDIPADERTQYTCDVTFVGTILPHSLYSERITALEALRDFDLGIWSVHDVPDTLAQYYRGYALGAQMMRVLSAAKISLNVHGDFMRYGGNMRLFEAAAMGAFQLVDDRPGVHEWFTEGEHLVTYRDTDDLRDKVRHYLAYPDERTKIADAARAHVLAHHTYDHRLRDLEALLEDDHA